MYVNEVKLAGAINDFIIFIFDRINEPKKKHFCRFSFFCSGKFSTEKWRRCNKNVVCKRQNGNKITKTTTTTYISQWVKYKLTSFYAEHFRALQNGTLYFVRVCVGVLYVYTLNGWSVIYWAISSLRIVSTLSFSSLCLLYIILSLFLFLHSIFPKPQ